MPERKYERLPNLEAQSAFASKTLLTTAEFTQVSAYQHALAFTVAGIANQDLLTDIHKSVKQAIDDGISFSEFKKTACTTA